MSEQVNTVSVAEKAADRYTLARATLDRMRSDLVALAAPAIHRLHRQAETEYAAFLDSLDPRPRAFFEGTSRPGRTWPIPGTAYHLPDWQQGGNAASFEHTLVKETTDDSYVVSFAAFVKECTLAEYVGVCQGLALLSNPAESERSDGMDND